MASKHMITKSTVIVNPSVSYLNGVSQRDYIVVQLSRSCLHDLSGTLDGQSYSLYPNLIPMTFLANV